LLAVFIPEQVVYNAGDRRGSKGEHMSVSNAAPSSSLRLYYLDWIRVLAMFGVFIFHNSRFYDSFVDWHVKNATTNLAASVVVAFASQWIMPLFFLIAGAGVYYALKSRRANKFTRERLSRLLIPFIFGMLVIVVPQAYFQALYQGEQLSQYNIFQIYWLYLQSLPDLNTFHLWFLLDLFVISIVAVPLLSTRSSSGESIISKLAKVLHQPWALILLFVLSLTFVDIILDPAGAAGLGYRNGGFNIIAYLLFFIFGYLIFANPRIMEAFKKLRWLMLGIGIVAMIILFTFFIDNLIYPAKYFGTAIYDVSQFVQAISTWCWLLAILGLGASYLEHENRFLSYANEAVLPFYILHQTVIISIGFYVTKWNTGVGLKYLIISVSSFMVIILIYELLVRRINILRFLFGMKWQRTPGAKLAGAGEK
jgi:glucans biosynthesis protein C